MCFVHVHRPNDACVGRRNGKRSEWMRLIRGAVGANTLKMVFTLHDNVQKAKYPMTWE